MSYLLAGDVGATKVWLLAFDIEQNKIIAEHKYASADFVSLAAVIQLFQSDADITSFQFACFGLPGPVQNRQAQLTNLPWHVNAENLQKECHIDFIDLINDFHASALGVNVLHSSDLLCLQEGSLDAKANRLVLGAGSGLGVSPSVHFNGKFIPQPSEGGHMDFAPVNDLQVELFLWLFKKWSHVSYERLLSGEGLFTLYHFFNRQSRGYGRKNMKPERLREAALEGDENAIKTLTTFVEIYGAYIGSVALFWHAQGGIYIAGGIANKIQDWMQTPAFFNALLNKGRMTDIVKSHPIYLVTNEKVGLMGALEKAKLNLSRD